MEAPRHTTPGTLQPPKVYCIAQQHLFQGLIAISPQNKENGLLRIRRTGNTTVFPAPLLNLTSAGSLACVRSNVSGCSRRKPWHCAVGMLRRSVISLGAASSWSAKVTLIIPVLPATHVRLAGGQSHSVGCGKLRRRGRGK